MKVKEIVPEVQIPSQAAPQTELDEPIYKGLDLIEEIVPFLQRTGNYPSADACENLNRTAYHRAERLLELVGWGEETLENEVGTSREPPLYYATEGVAFQVQLMRLASKTLFEAYGEDRFANKPR